MKNTGSGIGRRLTQMKRIREDKEYREKQNKIRRDYYLRNRKRKIRKTTKWAKEMSEYANKRCKVCDKLLNYRTMTNLCNKHKGQI